MIDITYLNQLKKFSLLVRKRVTSNYAGPRRSIAGGAGIVFKDYRIYAPGDDFRAIDWKVYARTDNFIVKTYEEERNLEVHVIVDKSKSMDFGGKVTKKDFASMLGVGFAYLAIKDNLKFKFTSFSDKLESFQAKKGMQQLASMVDYLNKLKSEGPSELSAMMTQYKKFLGQRCLIVLISDFLIDPEEIKSALVLLSKHEVRVIQVLDKAEKEIAVEGDYILHDSETGENMKLFISNRLRTQYQDLLDKHAAHMRDICYKLNMNFHQITTDKPLFDAFYEILA